MYVATHPSVLRDETGLETVHESAKETQVNTYDESSHSFLQIAQLPFFASLAPMQRVMLLSNGTLTDILQAFTLEEIGVHKFFEHVRYDVPDFRGEETLERGVVLYSKRTSRHYVYAESLIALERLPSALVRELQAGSEPLGRLQLKHRLETFKELIDLRISKSEKAARFLESDSSFLIRSYRVYIDKRPCMVIHECFPAS
jgi:chorismate-pyruvate lyase